MNEHFEEMLRRLKLTKPQRVDARTKYGTIAKLLHDEFYDTEYTGGTKLLIGSYGKRTNNRPPADIDLLFKIPLEVYEQHEQSPGSLLQRVRKVIGDHYTTTEKISAWGKVVLVKFPDGKHDVELLPGYEIGGVFMIPNTENGGSWDSFDVRADLAVVEESDVETGGKTRPLIRIVKRWAKNTKTVTIKGFEIEKYCADFLKTYDYGAASWAQLVADFFKWLQKITTQDATQIQTAVTRTTNALAYESQEKYKDACNEWRKVFGDRTFPAYSPDLGKITALANQFAVAGEMHIENLYPVRIDPAHSVTIHSTVSGKGFRPYTVKEFLERFFRFPKHMDLTFAATTNVPGKVRTFWKVRNFGEEAERLNQLRGEITEGTGLNKRSEKTRYLGDHYVECYIVKDGVCVAKDLQFVPIGAE